MSNKAVTPTYRAIIDKVVNGVRPDFEENGIEEAVLVHLQQAWEAKLAQSRVTDFSNDPRLGAYQKMLSPPAESSTSGSKGLAESSNTNGPTSINQDVKPEIPSTSKVVSPKTKASSTPKPLPNADSNELGSDLDESDEDDLLSDENAEDEDGSAPHEGDVVVALYEKVQRVKNKWKVTLKDGIIAADGKDYLFSKLQGELDW